MKQTTPQTMSKKVDEFKAADALIGMAVPNNDEEELHGLYDKRRNVKFPVKLMQILDDESYNHIISWTPDGKAFAVLKPTILEEKVLPAVFDNKQNGNSKFKSFLRKLYRWGFLKKFHQSDDYTYYHKAFQRGNLSLCLTITRLPNVKKPSATKSNTNSIQSSKATQMDVNAALAGDPSSLALAAAAGGADSLILDSLRQKVALNELMKAAALKAAVAKGSATASPNANESVEEGGKRTAEAAGIAAPSPSSALPALSALQLAALTRGNNVHALSPSLTLGDRLLLQQQQQHHHALLQQQLSNELLLASMGSHQHIPAGLLAHPNHLNSSASALLAAQQRQARINPLLDPHAASLLGQFPSNDSLLLSNVGSIGAMNEATKNLYLASFVGGGTGGGLSQPASIQQEAHHAPAPPTSPPQTQQQSHQQQQPKGRVSHHTQVMSGALDDLMKRQKILETLEANLNVGQIPNLGGAQNRYGPL